jgi:hypothetical protein
MWVWDAGAPQLTNGVPRTGTLPHVRITYLSDTAAFPLCCFAYTRSRSTWLRAVKCAPCLVLETRMPHVMDDRALVLIDVFALDECSLFISASHLV